MKREQIGLNTYLYTFKTYEEFTKQYKKLSGKGRITQVFFDSTPYAFELRENRVVM